MIHIVTLFRSPTRLMLGFTDEITASSLFYRRLMDNVWICDTDISTIELNARLVKHINESDKLFVATLNGSYSGWLEKSGWDWLEKADEFDRFYVADNMLPHRFDTLKQSITIDHDEETSDKHEKTNALVLKMRSLISSVVNMIER